MNSKKSDNPKDGSQDPKRVVKLTRPPPRAEKKPAAAKPKGAIPGVYLRMGLALLLIAVLVIGVNQAMLFLMK